MAQMMDRLYILAGLAWLVFGMAFGIWMGMSESFHYANPHAHANLVGFAASVLFGLICAVYPALKTSRLVVPQFLIYQAGAVLLVWGKVAVANDHTNIGPVVTGSLVTFLGALLFVALFVLRASKA